MIEEPALALESTDLPETSPHFSIMLELLAAEETGDRTGDGLAGCS